MRESADFRSERRRATVELELTVEGDADALERVPVKVLLPGRLLVGIFGPVALVTATGTVLLSLRITVGWRCVLFRRMDPDLVEADRMEADPVDEVSVAVRLKLNGIDADSDVAQENSSSGVAGGEDGAESVSGALSGRLMMSLSLTLRSLQLEYRVVLVIVVDDRMLRSSSVVVSIMSRTEPKEDVLITSD